MLFLKKLLLRTNITPEKLSESSRVLCGFIINFADEKTLSMLTCVGGTASAILAISNQSGFCTKFLAHHFKTLTFRSTLFSARKSLNDLKLSELAGSSIELEVLFMLSMFRNNASTSSFNGAIAFVQTVSFYRNFVHT